MPWGNIETLSDHAGIVLRKSKPTWKERERQQKIVSTCLSSKRKSVGPHRGRDLLTDDIAKAEILDSFIALVFTVLTGLQQS